MTKKRIRLIYGTVTGVAVGIAGVLMMAACVRIYRGDYAVDGQLYSPAAVAAAFRPIAIAVYVALGLLIGGLILNTIFPGDPEKPKVQKQYGTILLNLQKRYDPTDCPNELQAQILAQRKLRKSWQIGCFAVLAVCSIVFLSYALNIGNFPLNDATGSVIKAMWFFIPCIAIPFGFSVFAHYAQKRSMLKEIELLKGAISQGASAAVKTEKAPLKATGNTLKIVKCAILCLAVGMMVYGIVFGGTKDVLTKAINLCTECVGLG